MTGRGAEERLAPTAGNCLATDRARQPATRMGWRHHGSRSSGHSQPSQACKRTLNGPFENYEEQGWGGTGGAYWFPPPCRARRAGVGHALVGNDACELCGRCLGQRRSPGIFIIVTLQDEPLSSPAIIAGPVPTLARPAMACT